MVETKDEWREIIRKAEDTGADGLELNFGRPHGTCERGMGSAVGNEPAVLQEIARWAVEFATTPVIVKLTPNVGDILEPGEAVLRAWAHAISLINTVKSLMGVDLERMVPLPRVGGASTNGGYCGPAVKPIALHLLSQLARHPGVGRLPISGIGGISNFRDAAEFIALGATSVQVCTAVMHYGYRIVEEMIEGLSDWLDDHGMRSVNEPRGRAIPQVQEWGELDLSYRAVADISADKCIGCQLCYVACMDGAHQCIHLPGRTGGRRARGGPYPPPEGPPGSRGDGGSERGRGAVAGPVRRRGGVHRLQSVRACVPGAGVHHDRGKCLQASPRGRGTTVSRRGSTRCPEGWSRPPARGARDPWPLARRPGARDDRERAVKLPGLWGELHDDRVPVVAQAHADHVAGRCPRPDRRSAPKSASPIGSTDYSTAPDGRSFATAPGGLMNTLPAPSPWTAPAMCSSTRPALSRSSRRRAPCCGRSTRWATRTTGRSSIWPWTAPAT